MDIRCTTIPMTILPVTHRCGHSLRGCSSVRAAKRLSALSGFLGPHLSQAGLSRPLAGILRP